LPLEGDGKMEELREKIAEIIRGEFGLPLITFDYAHNIKIQWTRVKGEDL